MSICICLACDGCNKHRYGYDNSESRLYMEALAAGWRDMGNGQIMCDECADQYISVCFVVKVDELTRKSLSILEDGDVELDQQAMNLLVNSETMFSFATTGVAGFAEEAGADPSCWEDFQ